MLPTAPQSNRTNGAHRSNQSLSFDQLVQEHDEQVSAVVHRYTSCRATAAEIKQKAFIRAYEKLSLYRGEAAFGTWLFTIVRTVALDHLNRQKRRGENRQRYGSTLPISGSPERQMSKLDAKTVRDAVRSLPEADALLLDLHYFQQRDVKEIAAFLDCTPSHIRTKLTRARTRAKAGIERYYGSELKDLYPGWRQKKYPDA